MEGYPVKAAIPTKASNTMSAAALRRLLGTGRRVALRIHPRAKKPALPKWQPADSASSLRVGVVGAGISGLVTARVLCDLGHKVIVYEAQKRVGGRIYTMNFAGDPGLLAEAGAGRFADTHAHTMYWLKRFNIPLAPIYPEVGHLIRLCGTERQVGPDTSRLSTSTVHNLVHQPSSWELEHGSIDESAIAFIANSLTQPMWYRILGGASQLPDALAATLAPNVHLNSAVTGITQSSESVEIHTDNATKRFDRVVVTAPVSVQDRIDFRPPLSEQKCMANEESEVQSSLRVFVLLRGREWLPDGECGWGCTKDGIEVWHLNSDAHSENYMLVLYAQGEPASPLVALDRRDREKALLARLDKMFPGSISAAFAVSSHCWDDVAWAKGAQTTNRGKHWKILGYPEGRVHFADEYCTPDGWINGAIDSAYRVVSEICATTAAAAR